MMRDTASIAKLQVCTQPDGSLAFFFGNTTIRAITSGNDLLPLGGDQVACGEWYDLGLDEVEEYLRIIEKHIFQKNL